MFCLFRILSEDSGIPGRRRCRGPGLTSWTGLGRIGSGASALPSFAVPFVRGAGSGLLPSSLEGLPCCARNHPGPVAVGSL